MIRKLWKARQGLTVLGLKGAEALFGAAMTIALARLLGAETFGIFAFGLATTTLLAIPIKNGASTLVTKSVAVANRENDPGDAGPLLDTGIRVALVYSCAIAGLLFAYLSFDKTPSAFTGSVAMFSLGLPFLCLIGLLEGVLRGSFKPTAAILVGTVFIPSLVLCVLFLWPQLVVADGWKSAAKVYVGSAVCVFLVTVIWTLPLLKGLFPVPSAQRVGWKTWSVAAFPFVIVSGLLIFNRQIDVILLGLLSGEREAGIYRIAAQAAVLVTFGVQAIGHLYAPHLAAADTRTEPHKIAVYLKKSIAFSMLFGVTALLGLIVWGDDIIRLLAGEEYLPGYPIMLMLCAANLAVALNGATSQALFMQGHQTKAAWVFAAAAVWTVIANVTLIPLYGMIGAAIATSSAIVLWSLGLRVLACRVWGLSFMTLAVPNRAEP
ncbi:oligosaccharide flippase family protein [Tropicibacter oceani]|uniref:Oligosaccharide flippase family protein n=1 Tax=Tropicibacter oceani TaxID=3058420 RepID=A0ABY8QIZ9_9RHOB|nr:oligosaccharide flippase family protein [Tropicibacter oceani]WGW04495.1 oligosaccharide flippase family protein [Tropicibacter oceani]